MRPVQPRSTTRQRFVATLCLLLLTACAAPDPADRRTGPGGVATSQPMASDYWRQRPVAVRIYPTSRFVVEDGQPLLNAQVELFDQMGDPMKSSGRVHIELFAAPDRPRAAQTLLYEWHIELRTQADQQAYYDVITRGYLLRLEVDDASLADRPTLLRVTFTPPDAGRLRAEAIVRTGW